MCAVWVLTTVHRKPDVTAMYVQYEKIIPDSVVQMTNAQCPKLEREVFMTVRCKHDITATYMCYLGN